MTAPAVSRDVDRGGSDLAQPRVKFCGLVRPEDGATAARLGARYVGTIFAGGPRLVTPDRARTVIEAARLAASPDARPLAVGVMGLQSAEEIVGLASEAGIDVVQLHGDPDAEQLAAIRARWPGPVWGVLRIAGDTVPAHAPELFAAADAVVLDARVPGRLGGTGATLPWEALAGALARVRGSTPVVLAGGLSPENVATAARALAPSVVDVSSGVERAPGVKDPARMAAFVAALAHRSSCNPQS